MKKVFYLIAIVLFCACEEISPVPETFTFNINGTEMDFSENIVVSKKWLSGEIAITGKKTGVGKITMTLSEPLTGVYNENNYVFNDDDFTYKYRLSYTDNNDNLYTYYTSSINEWFIINIKKFENRIDGEVSGEFSGFLVGSILNESSAMDSVVIENGKFSTQISDKIE